MKRNKRIRIKNNTKEIKRNGLQNIEVKQKEKFVDEEKRTK